MRSGIPNQMGANQMGANQMGMQNMANMQVMNMQQMPNMQQIPLQQQNMQQQQQQQFMTPTNAGAAQGAQKDAKDAPNTGEKKAKDSYVNMLALEPASMPPLSGPNAHGVSHTTRTERNSNLKNFGQELRGKDAKNKNNKEESQHQIAFTSLKGGPVKPKNSPVVRFFCTLQQKLYNADTKTTTASGDAGEAASSDAGEVRGSWM